MEKVLNVVRYLVYIFLLGVIVTWLQNRIFDEISTLPKSIEIWLGNGLWYWIWHDNRYTFTIALCIIALVLTIFAQYFIRIPRLLRTTQISTYVIVGLKAIQTMWLYVAILNLTPYSTGIKTLSIICALIITGVIYSPFVLVAYNLEEVYE